LKIVILVGCWWLTPVILATREAEIKRIAVRSLPNSSTRPYLKKTLHKNRAGRVAHGEGPEFKPQYPPKKKKQTDKTKKDVSC
jgi:hypothetical protein